MKIEDLKQLQETFTEMVKCSNHSFSYEINSNLFNMNNALALWTDRVNKYAESIIEKDCEGNPFLFVSNEIEGVLTNEKGTPFIFSEKSLVAKYPVKSKLETNQFLTKRVKPEILEESNKVFEKFYKENIEVKILGMNEEDLKEDLKKDSFAGIDLIPLFKNKIIG